MNWEDERYVRLYVRDTGDWCALSWDAQALLMHLFRKADRSGIVQLGKRGRANLPAMLGHGNEAVRIDSALSELVLDGCVELRGDNLLVIPNFTKAQEAKQSDRRRQEESRGKRLAEAMAQPVSAATSMSHAVTPGHARSHAVTPSVPSVLSHAVPNQTTEIPFVPKPFPLHGPDRLCPPARATTPPAPKGVQHGQGSLLPEDQPRVPKPDRLTQIAIALLGELSAARQRVDPKCNPLDPVPGNLEQILGRLRDRPIPHTPEQIRHVIAVCEARARVDATAREYFDAVSPFRKRNIGRWLGMDLEKAQRAPAGRYQDEREPPSLTDRQLHDARRSDARARDPKHIDQLLDEMSHDHDDSPM